MSNRGGLQAELSLYLGDLHLDLALDVGAGEVVAVVGPNGAGKTTLLRALAGLVPLRNGRVTLDGHVLDDTAAGVRLPPERRAAGVVFADHLLFPHLSAADNVAFGLRARGVPRRAAAERASAWLDRLGLREHRHAPPGELSSGQSQRVALARALAIEPAMLLLDEPLSALDVETRLAVRRDLRRHIATFAGPCLLVTHEPLEAVALADRLVVLEQGRVVQTGDAVEVTRRPRSPWAARLAGLNLYRGSARAGIVELDGGGSLVAADPLDGEVFAVVRPAAVALHRAPPEGSARNAWWGAVTSIEGAGDRVRVQVAATELCIVAEVTPAAVTALDLGTGGHVWASVKATEVDLYPA